MAYRLLRWALGAAVRFLTRLLGGIRVEGEEHVPAAGPVIVASNHLSVADPAILGAVFPREAWCLARADLFNRPILGRLIRALHGIPVEPGTADRSALKQSQSVLEAGAALALFPEGGISPTGRLLPLTPGAALLALRTGAPILPVALLGTDRLIPYGKKIPRFARAPITVRFGNPLPASELAGGLKGRAAVNHATAMLEQALARLLVESSSPQRQEERHGRPRASVAKRKRRVP